MTVEVTDRPAEQHSLLGMLLRLVTALLADIDDDWETSQCVYLTMNPPSPVQTA